MPFWYLQTSIKDALCGDINVKQNICYLFVSGWLLFRMDKFVTKFLWTSVFQREKYQAFFIRWIGTNETTCDFSTSKLSVIRKMPGIQIISNCICYYVWIYWCQSIIGSVPTTHQQNVDSKDMQWSYHWQAMINTLMYKWKCYFLCVGYISCIVDLVSWIKFYAI